MPLRIGHRGAAGHQPENTLVAIAAGIRLGADFVEVDVQQTRDGHLILMHDKRVDRTTNGNGWVKDMTLDELRALDAGKGQRIPTLDEALTAAAGRAGMLLEIITPGIARRVVEAVHAHPVSNRVIYSSFLHAELLDVRAVEPQAETMALLEGVPVSLAAFATDAGATHAGLSRDSITPELVGALHERGVRVVVYTLNDREDITSASRLGVDGIITDFPERLAGL